MKLTNRNIPEFLKRPTQSAGVLIYGPDEGLVRERVKTIIHAVLGENPDPFAIIELNGASFKENETRLFEECAAMGFLVSKRVIVLRDVPEKIAKDVEAVIPTLDASTYLIVAEGELTPRAPMRQLFEQHQKLAALPCYKDEAQDIAQLIRTELAKTGHAIKPDAMHALAARLGNDRGVSISEIAKLATYTWDTREITLADVDALIPDNATHEGSDIAYALVAGDAARFDKHVSAMLRDGTQPIMILRAIGRHIQRLSTVHSLSQDMPVEDAMKQLKPAVFFKEEAAFKQQLRALPHAALLRLLKRVVEAEEAIKTGRLSPELALGGMHQLTYRKAG